MITANLRFNPIGQGCFYTGELSSEIAKYRFVYDCGSNSNHIYIDRSVERFRRNLGDEPIDLIIVSHYDYDHVNKINSLIRGKHVKRLIIPYVETIERLLVYSKAGHCGEDYRKLIENPLKYFVENENFEIDEIIIVGSSDNQILDPPVPIEPNDPKVSDKIEFSDKVDGKEVSMFSGSFLDQSKSYHSVAIKCFRIPFQVSINLIWEFRFYVKERNNQTLMDNFNNDLNEIKNEININSYEDMFKDHIREKIRKIYEKQFRDINSTSLVVYSGPIRDEPNRPIHQYSHLLYNRIPYNFMIYPKGTLLTGDINVSRASDLNDLTGYFVHYLPKTSIFQVPHHGSQKNWNFDHPNDFDNFSFYVINHGIGRKHHPSVKVVTDIDMETEGNPHFNNESQFFNIYFHVD